MNHKVKCIIVLCYSLLLSCSKNQNIENDITDSIIGFHLPNNYHEHAGVFTIKLSKKTVEKIIEIDSVFIVLHLPRKGVVFYPLGKTGMAEYADSSGIHNLFGEDTIFYSPDFIFTANKDKKFEYRLFTESISWRCIDSSSFETIMKHTTIDICYGDGNIISQLKYIPE